LNDVVVDEYLRRRGTPRSVAPQFWCVEFMDYLFHRSCVDMVISPAAKPSPPRHGRIKRVGLIVRREVEELAPRTDGGFTLRPCDVRNLTFMLSGSILGQIGPIAFRDLPYKVVVVGQQGSNDDQVTYHGKTLNKQTLYLAGGSGIMARPIDRSGRMQSVWQEVILPMGSRTIVYLAGCSGRCQGCRR
jgi:hypothetical protein